MPFRFGTSLADAIRVGAGSAITRAYVGALTVLDTLDFSFTENVDGEAELVASGTGTIDITSSVLDYVGLYSIDAGATAPINLNTPNIDGTPTVGEALTVQPGLWMYDAEGVAPVLTVQWLRDGAAISGATNTTYTLVSADAGTTITVRETVTQTNPASATSAGVSIASNEVWSLADNGDGTFTINTTPAAPAALTGTDNGDGTFTLS